MGDNDLNSPWPVSMSSAHAELQVEGTSASIPVDFPLPISPQRASSLLDDDFYEQDDSTSIYSYSYYSTWSSNYTISNLVGPGRLLGNLLSSAGSSLERRLGKLAYRLGLGSYAMAEAGLWNPGLLTMLQSEDMLRKEKACNILLGYASSNNPAIQFMAFIEIVRHAVLFPSLRSVAEIVCQKRSEHIDIVVSLWKRPGLDYGSLWLSYYNAALRCLSTHPSLLMSAIDRSPKIENSFDFSHFEDILACCRDKADTMIAVGCVCWDWNRKGMDTYVKGKGYNNPLLLKLAIAFHTVLTEFTTSNSRDPAVCIYLTIQMEPLEEFINGMWESLRALEPDKSDELLEDDSQLAAWTEIFKIHYILQSSLTLRLIPSVPHGLPDTEETWKKECHRKLPNPEHAKLRERLLQLEDIHGDTMRECFPPKVEE